MLLPTYVRFGPLPDARMSDSGSSVCRLLLGGSRSLCGSNMTKRTGSFSSSARAVAPPGATPRKYISRRFAEWPASADSIASTLRRRLGSYRFGGRLPADIKRRPGQGWSRRVLEEWLCHQLRSPPIARQGCGCVGSRSERYARKHRGDQQSLPRFRLPGRLFDDPSC
jgi:hypothetical protein